MGRTGPFGLGPAAASRAGLGVPGSGPTALTGGPGDVGAVMCF